jgi:hypothetical protein
MFNQNIGLSQLHESTRMLCFGAGWQGENKVTFRSEFHHGREAMLESLWSMFDEADTVMGWNSAQFDSKHVRREFLEAGMAPPSPWRELDLMREAKKLFRFPSNRLQYVSTLLGLEGKVSHEGHSLWTKCLAGDPKAWARMKRYQVMDVKLLMELYPKLLPWLTSMPNANLFRRDGAEGCVKCGSLNIQKRGFKATALGVFQQWHCVDCGGWSRSGKSEYRVDLRASE